MPPTPKLPKNEWYIPLSLAPLQTLLGKGLARGSLTALFGPPEAGKSSLASQIATDVAIREGGEGAPGNFLVFETELKPLTYVEMVSSLEACFGVGVNIIRCKAEVFNKGSKTTPVWNAKFAYDGKAKKGAVNLYLLSCPDLVPIMHLHGRGIFWDISSASGKIKIGLENGSFAKNIAESPLGAFVKENDIKAVVYDSITNPLDEIPAVGENFPARSDATQLWMIQVQKLANHFNIPVIAIAHESKNETNPFSLQLKVEGGKGVGYNLGCTLYLAPSPPGTPWGAILPKGSGISPGPLPLEARHVFLMRQYGERGWKRFVSIERTDKGFVPYGSAVAPADETPAEETTDESESTTET